MSKKFACKFSYFSVEKTPFFHSSCSLPFNAMSEDGESDRRVEYSTICHKCEIFGKEAPCKHHRGVLPEIPMYVCNEATGYALVNMTPHDLHFYLDGDASEGKEPDYTIPRSGIAPWMTSNTQMKVMVQGGIPVWTHSEFTGLDLTDFHRVVPGDPRLRGLIVARYVAEFLKKTGSSWPGGIYGVDTGPQGVVRSPDGKILGTKRLEVWIRPML